MRYGICTLCHFPVDVLGRDDVRTFSVGRASAFDRTFCPPPPPASVTRLQSKQIWIRGRVLDSVGQTDKADKGFM